MLKRNHPCRSPLSRCPKSSRVGDGAPGGPGGPRPVLRLLQQPLLRGGEQLARHHRQPPVPHLDVQKALPREGMGPYRADLQFLNRLKLNLEEGLGFDEMLFESLELWKFNRIDPTDPIDRA